MADKITVTIVVNGQPTQISGPAQASLERVIPQALEQTGNVGQPPENWELRNAAGQLLGSTAKMGDFVGQTLFLNLKAGIGGTTDEPSIR